MDLVKISMGKKYTTRCGWPVRVLCVDVRNEFHPVVAIIKGDKGESVFCYTEDGRLYEHTQVDNPYDLVEDVPETSTYHVVSKRDGHVMEGYRDQHYANIRRYSDCCRILKLTIKGDEVKGEFLS